MLQATTEQAIALDDAFIAIEIEIAHARKRLARYVHTDARQRQAAFSPQLRLAFERYDLGVDKVDRIGIVFGSPQSMTTRRFKMPTCGAASPQPLFLYMVAAIRWASFFRDLSLGSHGSQIACKPGSGAVTIFNVLKGRAFLKLLGESGCLREERCSFA